MNWSEKKLDNLCGLNYAAYGEQTSRAIVFLHGFMGSSIDWDPIIKELDEGLFYLALDLPGHGKTKISEDNIQFLMDYTIQSMEDLFQSLHIEKMTLIGYSMGGRVALKYASQFPGRLTGLILESVSPGLQSEKEIKDRWEADQQLAKRIENGDFKKFLNEWYNLPIFGQIRDHQDYEQLIRQRLQNDPKQLAGALRKFSVAKQTDFRDWIERMELPVMLICGELDEKYKKISDEMVHLNPKLKRLVLKDCGHNTHFEKPQEYADVVKKFLCELI